jgi:hypothetical protein
LGGRSDMDFSRIHNSGSSGGSSEGCSAKSITLYRIAQAKKQDMSRLV